MSLSLEPVTPAAARRNRRLNVSQAASELGVCRATMTKLIRSGAVEAHRVSPRRIVIAVEEIERYRACCRL